MEDTLTSPEWSLEEITLSSCDSGIDNESILDDTISNRSSVESITVQSHALDSFNPLDSCVSQHLSCISTFYDLGNMHTQWTEQVAFEKDKQHTDMYSLDNHYANQLEDMLLHEFNGDDREQGGAINICQVTPKQTLMHPIASSSSSSPLSSPHAMLSSNDDYYGLQGSPSQHYMSKFIGENRIAVDIALRKNNELSDSSSPHTSCYTSEQTTSCLSYDEEERTSPLHSLQAEYQPDNQHYKSTSSTIDDDDDDDDDDATSYDNRADTSSSTEQSSDSIEQPTMSNASTYIHSSVKDTSIHNTRQDKIMIDRPFSSDNATQHPTKRISLPVFSSSSPRHLDGAFKGNSIKRERVSNEQEARLQLPAKYLKSMPSIDSLSSFHADMYTPRKVKGEGRAKLGECPVCYEEGVSTWFRLKISSYWYHMNFYHGISSVTRRPYRNPVQIRKHRLSQLPESSNASSVSSGSSTEALSELHEGLCHNCDRWIAMDSIRHIAVKVPMIYWWKHAQQCHHLKKKKQN